jgi:hypothetical protein
MTTEHRTGGSTRRGAARLCLAGLALVALGACGPNDGAEVIPSPTPSSPSTMTTTPSPTPTPSQSTPITPTPPDPTTEDFPTERS